MSDQLARVPMQSSAWLDAAAAASGRTVERFEVDGASVGLVRRGRLRTFPADELYEPADAVWRDADAARALARELRGTPLLLRRLLADSPLVEALPRAIVRPGPASPTLALDERWTAESGALSKRRASDLRRARRRAEEEGEVAVTLESPSPVEAAATLDRIAAVEDKGWKGEAGTSLARDDARRRFFAEYARRAAADGTLRAAFLTIAGNDAAAQLAVEWRNAYWLLKIGYDASYARASPGQLLMLETIRSAAARGLERYELLGTTADWTRMWTEDERATVSLVHLPLSARGALAAVEVARARRR